MRMAPSLWMPAPQPLYGSVGEPDRNGVGVYRFLMQFDRPAALPGYRPSIRLVIHQRYEVWGIEAIRMAAMPRPCRPDDRPQVAVRGPPALFALQLTGIRDETGGIPGASRPHDCRDASTGHLLGGLDDFAHAVSPARPDIVSEPTRLAERDQDFDMGIRKIENVDIVADAGSIGCRIVTSKNVDMWAPPLRHLEHQWDEMRLRTMVFSKISAEVGASGVEVSQYGCAYSMATLGPEKDPFADMLGFAVGIAGRYRLILIDN